MSAERRRIRSVVLDGDKLADCRSKFVVNLQTAMLLGIDVPPTLIATADELIE